jgi:transcriptional regulator with XRE-family HTH domain
MPADAPANLGRKIREARMALGMTQAQLAEAAGVVESYVSKIEHGRLPYTPSGQTLRLMADALRLDPIELLLLAGKTPMELAAAAESPEAREFFSLVRRRTLRDEDWEDLNRLIRSRFGEEK